MSTGERLIRGFAGVVLLGEAAILGAGTVDAIRDNEPQPEAFVFQDVLRGDDEADFSHFDILNGTLLNTVAVAGLAAGGLRLARSALRANESNLTEE